MASVFAVAKFTRIAFLGTTVVERRRVAVGILVSASISRHS